MKQRLMGACCAMLALSGCATTGTPSVPGFVSGRADAWQPTIDRRGDFEQARYEQDLSECRAYADANPEADPEQAARDGAVRSGLLTTGAAVLLGVTVGAVLIPVAAASGFMGGNRAQQEAVTRHRSIIASCLSGRGYSVIG